MDCSVSGDILVTNKSISVDSFGLVNPQLYKVIWLLNCLLLGRKKTLEHICQMTNIELIMEVLCSLSEVSLDLSMETQGSLNDWHNLLLDISLELLEMLGQVS